jgi:peptide/nickel transport system permease protein
MAIAMSLFVGGFLGVSAGYFGGLYDGAVMRVMDVVMAIPGFLLAVCVSAALGDGVQNTAFAIAAGCVPGYARLMRALALSVRDTEYVEAASVCGAGHLRIMFGEIVPNTLSPVIVESTLRIGACILMISGLSFIGLGVQPPTPEWGSMLSVGREYIRTFWPIVTFPGLTIMMTLFGFNLFGDGLRDALDPRLKN